MAEEKVRKTLYKYQANSNLVLQAEREGPRISEPTGEVRKLAWPWFCVWHRLARRFPGYGVLIRRFRRLFVNIGIGIYTWSEF